MPRSPQKRATPQDAARAEIDALLTLAQTLNGWSRNELAKRIGFTEPTLMRRRKDVYSWDLGELKKLALYTRKEFSEVLGKVGEI